MSIMSEKLASLEAAVKRLEFQRCDQAKLVADAIKRQFSKRNVNEDDLMRDVEATLGQAESEDEEESEAFPTPSATSNNHDADDHGADDRSLLAHRCPEKERSVNAPTIKRAARDSTFFENTEAGRFLAELRPLLESSAAPEDRGTPPHKSLTAVWWNLYRVPRIVGETQGLP